MIMNRKCERIFQLSKNNRKLFATQVNIKEAISNLDIEWQKARPYNEIPGPSSFEIIRGFMPGGDFYNKPRHSFATACRERYGDFFRIRGMFGRNDFLITFDPNNFELVYRTEGVWPNRRGLETLSYYRENINPERFKNGDLLSHQGESWGKFRSTVNPVLMQPKTIRVYVPKMDGVTDQFIERIRNIRDPETNEVPGTFEKELNNWALQSVCLIALDTRLNIINDQERNPEALELIKALDLVFKLPVELDFKPSIWKIIATPKFKQLMEAYDVMTKISIKYIEEAMERYELTTNLEENDNEKSILERLIKIDKNAAVVMALEMFFAGVDTTTSAITGCLLALSKNPDKQEKLRQELKKILPNRNTPITESKLNQIPYLRAIIKESIRMFPVTNENLRASGQNIVLNGYQVPKGVDLILQTTDLYRDEKYFPQPNEFLPERWLRNPQNSNDNQSESAGPGAECPFSGGSGKPSNPFVYLPFGFGTRMCIGKRIVEMEMEIALAKIIRNFQVEFNYPEKDVFSLLMIYSPHQELKFRFIDLDQ